MEQKENANRSTPAGKRSYRTPVGLLLLLIAYGSLFPLTWNFEQPQDFIFKGPIHLVDIVENVLLFMPLGWLLAWKSHGHPRKWLSFTYWFFIALATASVLQWLQKYLPRVPQLSDIIFNMLGYSIGWLAGMVSVNGLNRAMQRHQNLQSADRFALFMIGIWIVSELFPLIPTFDVSSLVSNIKSLWQQDAWQPRRMTLHVGMTVIGLDALAHLLRSVSLDRHVRPFAFVAAAMMLAGKIVIVGQSPGIAVVLGILGGALIWWGLDHLRESQRLTTLLLIATGTYMLHAIWPLQFRAPPVPMHWMPFASALTVTIESTVTTVAFECLCFGAIIWSAVRAGGVLSGMTTITVILAFSCEWAQRYLPTRTPEITSVIFALSMGWLVAWLNNPRRFRR